MMIKHLLLGLSLLLATQGLAYGCFGPKLFIGVGETTAERVIFELAALYVKEKTGTESVRVELAGKSPIEELSGERLDMVLLSHAETADSNLTPVLMLPALPVLFAGRRPLEALQFSTVRPALAKLQLQLADQPLAELLHQVETGEPPAAAARRFLTDRGMI